MRKKLYILILILFVLPTNIVFGKEAYKAKINKGAHKKHDNLKEKSNNDRLKRSSYDDEEKPFWATRGKRQVEGNSNFEVTRYGATVEDNEKNLKAANRLAKEPPFWGTRGRRDSSSIESFLGMEYPLLVSNSKYPGKNCKQCDSSPKLNTINYENEKERREELMAPFWGNRGKRNSDGAEDDNHIPTFWANRGRRQDNEPFWGTRGRRQEDSPFWGNRGRRNTLFGIEKVIQDVPFWGNRGRRDEIEPFWGNRGRRETSEPFWGSRERREETEPFWGNRGRRDVQPFWGNRGRREESEPFWGTRGRREESEPFWGNRGRRKEDLKESILSAINDVENDIEYLARLRRSNSIVLNHKNPFWANRGRDSKMKYLFNGSPRFKFQHLPNKVDVSESNMVHDSRIYAEEPYYIMIERSSRSSAEDDPYFISRGKKENTDTELAQAARDRRGAIEDIVKSVRNDPYYIVRGKKNNEEIKISNSTTLHAELNKVRELICSTIDLMMIKNEGNKTKREVNDNERDRRTILKKLAAQLQMDPYFVSRGKKHEDALNNDDYLEEFINHVAGLCN